MAELKVLGFWHSPYTCRAEMALNLKGVKYEFIQEDQNNKSDLLLKHNPVHKKVPVLIHDGKGIAESMVIVEYIDEVFKGPPILPKDPHARAMARFWAKFIEEKCMESMWKTIMGTGEEREKIKAQTIENLKFLDHELEGKKFFGGDNIGYVDIAAISIGYWFGIMAELRGLEYPVTNESSPNLYKWMDEYVHDGIVQKSLPDKEKLTAVFKAYMETRKGDEK